MDAAFQLRGRPEGLPFGDETNPQTFPILQVRHALFDHLAVHHHFHAAYAARPCKGHPGCVLGAPVKNALHFAIELLSDRQVAEKRAHFFAIRLNRYSILVELIAVFFAVPANRLNPQLGCAGQRQTQLLLLYLLRFEQL